jgi:hypothetical protein
MSSFINTYGGSLENMTTGLGSVQRAIAAGLSINDIYNYSGREGFTFGQRAADYLAGAQAGGTASQNQISQLQSTFDQQLKEAAARAAEQQRLADEKIKRMQQQALEAQTRQASPEQTAQVLGAGKSLVIRPGARTRFSRPELQIKSMNI